MLLPSNISTNSIKSPTSVEGAEAGQMITVPVNSSATQDHEKNFALVTSLLVCNKTAGNIAVSGKIVNGSVTGHFLSELLIPPHVPYEIIQGNKFTLKEGDILFLWHDNTVDPGALDAILSYTLHQPLTTFDI